MRALVSALTCALSFLPCGQLPVDRAFLCADDAGTCRSVEPRSDECDAAASGTSRLAAPATGVQIKPAVAVYGMRAGMSFMVSNVAAKPMIVPGANEPATREEEELPPMPEKGTQARTNDARGHTFTYPTAQ